MLGKRIVDEDKWRGGEVGRDEWQGREQLVERGFVYVVYALCSLCAK